MTEDTRVSVQDISSSFPPSVLSKVSSWKVKSCALCKGSMLKSTSKIQHFHPKVSFAEGVQWIVNQTPDRNRFREVDATLVFDNESSVSIRGGVFSEFDDFGDESTEASNGSQEVDQKTM